MFFLKSNASEVGVYVRGIRPIVKNHSCLCLQECSEQLRILLLMLMQVNEYRSFQKYNNERANVKEREVTPETLIGTTRTAALPYFSYNPISNLPSFYRSIVGNGDASMSENFSRDTFIHNIQPSK